MKLPGDVEFQYDVGLEGEAQPFVVDIREVAQQTALLHGQAENVLDRRETPLSLSEAIEALQLDQQYQRGIAAMERLLENLPDGTRVIMDIDGKQHALLTYEEYCARVMAIPDLRQQIESGRTHVSFCPIGVALKRSIDAYGKALIACDEGKGLFRTDGTKIDNFKRNRPVEQLIDLAGTDESDALAYDVKNHDRNKHGGRTKRTILEQDGPFRIRVFNPEENIAEGRGRSPRQYVATGERGVHMCADEYFLFASRKAMETNRVTDDQTGTLFPGNMLLPSGGVPGAGFVLGFGQARVGAGDPGTRDGFWGARLGGGVLKFDTQLS